MTQYYRIEKAEFKDVNLDFLIDDLDLITSRDENENLLSSGEVPRFSDDATDEPIFSTMVDIEIQFLTDSNPDLDPTQFRSMIPSWVIEYNWIDNIIWINPDSMRPRRKNYISRNSRKKRLCNKNKKSLFGIHQN